MGDIENHLMYYFMWYCTAKRVFKSKSANFTFFLFAFRDLVTYLHSQDIDVYLISGGFHCVIQEVAKELNIPKENIHANRLKFYFTGKCCFHYKIHAVHQGQMTDIYAAIN